MAVPYIFATATTPILLSELDTNFATAITLGSTALTLGSTISTVDGLTLTNLTLTSVTSPISANNGGTGQSSYTIGDLLYASSSTALSTLSDVATGSVLISGGVGVAPSYSSSPTISGTTTSGFFIANGTITGSLSQGAYSYGTLGYSDSNILGSFMTSVNSYDQIIVQNTNAGASASTNIIVSNNLGTASTYFGEFGMSSSAFSGTGAFNAANTVYLDATSADLAIGTTTSNAIHFVVNSGATDAATISSAGVFSLGTALAVGSGGTGASTLTGYVYGNGTSAMTASTTIPNTAITGLGTMSTQNANAVAITGGSINGTTVGATTASTGAFTTVTAPTVVGGSSTTQVLTLQSTTGVGSGDSISLLLGNNGSITALNMYNPASGSGPTLGVNGLATSITALNLSTGLSGINNALSGTGVNNNIALTVGGTGGATATSFLSQMYMNSATQTLATLSHFSASPKAGLASSTITTQIGFNAPAILATQGAATVTNAYGFYGAIAAATNNYNLYMAGSANNLFNGYSFGLGGVMATTTSTATNTVTLTATQVASGFIVGTPTATASYTLPLASALDTELTNAATGYNFELVVFTTAAFAITLLTNTGWTLVGSMATGATANSFARFRARKTAAGAYSLYRIS